MGLSLLVIIFLGFMVSSVTGNSSYLMGAVIGSIALNIISYFFSDTIALKSSGAQKAPVEKYAELHQIVEDITLKANLKKKPEVYIINEPGPNAFATGRGENKSAVAVTTGLLATLNKSELEGVIAHEIAHIKNKDVLIMTVMVVLSGVISMLAHVALSQSSNRESTPVTLAVGIIAAIILPIAASIIQMSISRKREFVADASGALYTGYPEALASALKKISGYNQPLRHAGPATAHLYISCPFGGVERQGFLQKLFMTHPPIEERVKALTGEIL